MNNEARLLLDDVIAFCQRDGMDTRLINMLASARATELTEDSLTIEAPSRFAYSYLVKQRQIIERYLEEIAFAPLALNVCVPQVAAGTPTSRTEPVQAQGAEDGQRAAATPMAQTQTVPVADATPSPMERTIAAHAGAPAAIAAPCSPPMRPPTRG